MPRRRLFAVPALVGGLLLAVATMAPWVKDVRLSTYWSTGTPGRIEPSDPSPSGWTIAGDEALTDFYDGSVGPVLGNAELYEADSGVNGPLLFVLLGAGIAAAATWTLVPGRHRRHRWSGGRTITALGLAGVMAMLHDLATWCGDVFLHDAEPAWGAWLTVAGGLLATGAGWALDATRQTDNGPPGGRRWAAVPAAVAVLAFGAEMPFSYGATRAVLQLALFASASLAITLGVTSACDGTTRAGRVLGPLSAVVAILLVVAHLSLVG